MAGGQSGVGYGGCYGRSLYVLFWSIVATIPTALTLFLLEGLFRATNVLKHYRGFELPPGTKFNAYIKRLFENPAFKRTCSTEELYLDSYERYGDASHRMSSLMTSSTVHRYAFNRPNTSQVANAINSGRGLP